ncbi:MAG: MFS transporter [Rubrivivax sp.]|jgi:GPH family glycoside/pentoside/hexuronide:cation symporter|nr:MFS transporter [Rubrivivax sp.]
MAAGPRLLTVREMAAFSAPAALLLLFRAAAYVIPALYAERFQLDLAEIAGILFVMRTAEVLLQIPIGLVSDATRHPRHGRKPLVMLGIVLGSMATWFVYVPPDDVGLVYLGIWLSLATLAGSLTEVAYGAWSTEITNDYRERARCASYQTWASIAGKEMYALVPLLWFLSSNRINFESLQVTAWILAGVAPVLLLCAWRWAPAGDMLVPIDRISLRQLLDLVLRNGPLQRVLVVLMLWELGTGFMFGLDFMRIDSYLKAGEAVPLQSLFGVWAAMAGLAALQWVLKRHEKHHVWVVSMSCVACVLLAQLALSPGMPHLVPIIVGLWMLVAATVAGSMVVPMSLVGDLADYEALRSGQRAAGPMVAITQMTQKLFGGGAAAAALWVVSLFGFKPGQASYDATAAFGIQFVGLALPAMCIVAAAFVAWRYPISARRHRAIVRRLERRSPARAEPSTERG